MPARTVTAIGTAEDLPMNEPVMRLRSMALPVPGVLYLHSMPGRLEPFARAREAIASHRIGRVVCLTPMEEVWHKAPAYARALLDGVPWTQLYCPIPDFGLPEELKAFADLAQEIAGCLRDGQNVLVHCAAGIGRTGTFAMAVALQLGLPLEECKARVREAGSSPESSAQAMLVADLAYRNRTAE